MAFAVPMKMFGKLLVLEMNGIPSAEIELRRRTQKVRAPGLTFLICGAMRSIETLSIRSADLVLPVTEKMKNTLLRNYAADARRVVVIPNSVDTAVFKPLEAWRREIRQKLGMNRGMVVLYLGTFSARWRGTGRLFEAAEHIQRRRGDVTFLVVGSGPLLEEMSAVKTGREKVSHILFAGAVDHHLVPLYMNAADLFVYDVTEAANKLVEMQGLCPTKILEAMACGKPVITPKESELESMLQKSGGGLSASSMKELVELIEKLTDSPALVKSMGAKARQYVELNHDLTRLTRRMIELINDTVSFRGR
jgi:glycosyltransferase involved in cell wall biosynthesis